MEQSFDFHGKQRDNGIRKILAGDAASVFVVKQRHGKTSFEPAFDEIDRALFALYGIAHGKSDSDDRVPGSFCNFLFRKHIRFPDHADGIRPVRFRVSARRWIVARENQVGAHIHDVTGIRKNRNDAPRPVYVDIVRILRPGLANIQIADPGCVEHVGRPKIIPDPRELRRLGHARGRDIAVLRHLHVRRTDAEKTIRGNGSIAAFDTAATRGWT